MQGPPLQGEGIKEKKKCIGAGFFLFFLMVKILVHSCLVVNGFFFRQFFFLQHKKNV